MHPIAPCPAIPLPGASLIHGEGSPMVDVLRACRRIASSDSTVLVTGETGTGKEVIARFVHEHSRRAGKPLVPVNCGAIPEALLESELFGYVRGAFTGANSSRRGRLALADGGTLFLDEIGELPLSLQVKLLRVIQERCYEPVGSSESVPANFRLIAATNRDLAAEVEAGRFRRDLFFRLMVVPLELPPLRARPQDVLALFRHFWAKQGETRPVAPALLATLQRYDWPGNVRELENLVERLSVCAEGDAIDVPHLPAQFRRAAEPPAATGGVVRHFPQPVVAPVPAANVDLPLEPAEVVVAGEPPVRAAAPDPFVPVLPVAVPAPALPSLAAPDAPELPIDLPALLRQLEDRYIDHALSRTGGNKKAAADFLGLQRTTLVEKLRRRNRNVPAV